MSPIRKLVPAVLTAATWAALAFASPAQAGDYKYWYHDDNGNHDSGDLTNGNAPIPAPAWACGRRFFSGAQLQWIGDNGVGIGANNGGQDIFNAIVAHFGTAVGCKPRPRLENHPAGTVIAPRLGTHYVVIDPDAGSYWVDKNGSWPACNCAAPVGFKALVANIQWKTLNRAMALQLDRNAQGPSHDSRIDLTTVNAGLLELQRQASAEISKRRLTLAPVVESAVRQLEDQALASLTQASTLVDQARTAQDRGQLGEAYKALDRARLQLSRARWALDVVVQEMR